MKHNIVALSLFSGCGGLDIGSHLAGVPVLGAIDFDKDSIETLKNNNIFKKTKIFQEDIVDFDSNHFMNILKENNYNKFIIIGGPPCQPFSKAGYWIGNNSRMKDKDPRNMIGQYFRIVEELKPDGFLLENVESLMHPSNKHVIVEINNISKSLGYYNILFRANAVDFGVPQKRKRIFIIGSRKNIEGVPLPTHASKEKAEKLRLRPYVTVGESIKKYASDKYFEKEEVAKNGTYYEDLLRVPPGKNYIALTIPPLGPHKKFKKGKRFWNFLLKLHPDIQSWTIAAQPGPWVGPFHWNNRRLRIPEIAAIQTFPENYKFIGNRRSVQKQIGNAVPPFLAEQVIKFLIKNI